MIYKTEQKFDVIIIGSGAAGLGLALSLANNTKIALISKSNLLAGSSQRAQGGIAAVMSEKDSNESHIQDTLRAGAGLCHPKVVSFVVTQAKAAIEWLISQGVQFTHEGRHYHLNQEGGHSERRILHADDKTGSVVVKTLAEQVLAHSNITCFTEHTAVDLLVKDQQCFGVITLDNHKQNLHSMMAKITVLATGGASTAYLHTSNPDMNTGDGLAMAWRAGCRIANLEFNQFHPTCFYRPNTKPFLISEAVRGEGGRLILPNGKRFMSHYHPLAELAPRDIVARAIDQELKKHEITHVYLDIRHKPAHFIKKFFPTIYEFCANNQIDMCQDPIPVVPAAHYTCGGVVTNLQGQTDISDLYAIGEVACTGMHGANRMASNSLLECLVFAMSASKAIQNQLQIKKSVKQLNHWQADFIDARKLPITQLIQDLRSIMWQHVGIVRNNERLQLAKQQIENLKSTISQNLTQQQCHKNAIELRNLITVCELIVRSAIARKESRGLHFNTDHPNLLDSPIDTILSAKTSFITCS